ncbi:MAG: hypothetical protein CMF31_03690 [Kordiimonas sp.]|nr:hypothetical protein [Kordiimonas sp.]
MKYGKRLAGFAAATAVATVALSTPASALDMAEVQRQINALQAQMNEMKAAEKKSSGSDLKVKWKGAPQLSSKDGKFKMKVRGRVMADYVNLNDDSGMDRDATEFRRARLGVEGIVFKNIKYKFEVDFADNDVDITDAYLQWKAKPVSLTIGQQKVPVSLEEQTSSRYITFMERAALTDGFSFSRMIGIAASTGGDNWTVKAGIFQGDADDGSDEQGRTYAIRATFGPELGNSDAKVHVGASYFYRENDDDDGTLRYRQRPPVHIADRYVDTRDMGTDIAGDNDQYFGVELAGVLGPLSVQGEYGWLEADNDLGSNPTFTGGYVDVSYFITGESRNYKAKKGSFGRVKVKNPINEGGIGAVQVGVRYDTIDLSDNGIDCGEQESWIFGANWHLNNYTRIMANYSFTDVDGGSYDGESIDAFAVRFQVDW